MRKYLASLVCATVAFTFVGCGDKTTETPSGGMNAPAAAPEAPKTDAPAAPAATPPAEEKK